MTSVRIEHNATDGTIQEIPVDNPWILANRPSQVELSADNLTLAVGGSLNLSAQLYTPTLIDDNRQILTSALSIQLRIGDIVQTVSLVNGQWSDSVQFVAAGQYLIHCLSHPSNELVVEVS